MITFGFSAFLKLISSRAQPQQTLVRNRLTAKGEKSYDFHRRMRLLAHKYLAGDITLDEALLKIESIKAKNEKKAAKQALLKLAEWRAVEPGKIFTFKPAHFESPKKNFKVQFLPTFGIEIGGEKVAIHIWNTKLPDLDKHMTYAALSLFPAQFAAHEQKPDDLGVLSLPQSKLYRLSDVGDYSEVGHRLVHRLDDLFEQVRYEAEKSGIPLKDQPPAPPPG